MKLFIFKNAGPMQAVAPYFISVSMLDEVILPDNSFHVPIYEHQAVSRTDSNYSVEMCGFRLEADSPDSLLAPAAKLLSGLVNMARMPTYVLAASDSLLIYPVYTVGDEVFATTPGGPVFRDVELANVRSRLSDYLHTMEELGTLDHVETLHVRGIDRSTLGLIRPAFYFKKRIPNETEFWAPVFRSEDGRTIYTYAASAKREVPVDGGREILALHKIVAGALLDTGRLQDPYDLRPDRLFPTDLQPFLGQLTAQPYHLDSPNFDAAAIPLYRNGKAFVAVEHRQQEDRYSVFVGRDPIDLRARVTQDLQRRQVIDADSDVTLITD